MITDTIAVLLQATGPETMTLVEVIKMSIEECLQQAAILNADSSHPFMLLCGPDLEALADTTGI